MIVRSPNKENSDKLGVRHYKKGEKDENGSVIFPPPKFWRKVLPELYYCFFHNPEPHTFVFLGFAIKQMMVYRNHYYMRRMRQTVDPALLGYPMTGAFYYNLVRPERMIQTLTAGQRRLHGELVASQL